MCVELWVVRPSWPELTDGQKTELLRIADLNSDSEDRAIREEEISDELRELFPYGIRVENGNLVIVLSG
ncbi:MAG: hypothetical protein AAGC68_16150, partial [Verrucomicrobiota bacterium]